MRHHAWLLAGPDVIADRPAGQLIDRRHLLGLDPEVAQEIANQALEGRGVSADELVNWADLNKSNWEDFKYQIMLNDVVYYITYGELPPKEVSIEPEFERSKEK